MKTLLVLALAAAQCLAAAGRAAAAAGVPGSLCSGDRGYCVPRSQVEEVKASPNLLKAALAAGDRIKAGCAACDKEASGGLLAATLEQAGVADPQVLDAAAMALDAKYTGDLDRVAKDLAGSRKPADELLNLAGVLYANGVTRWDVIQGMLGLAVETANAKFGAKLKAPRLLAKVKRSFEGRRAGSNAPSLLSIDGSRRAVQVVKGSTHEFTLIGRNFQRGARYALWSPGRDPAAQPEPDTYGPELAFVNSSELRVTLAISKDSPAGKYVVAVENPDGKRSPEADKIVELVEAPRARASDAFGDRLPAGGEGGTGNSPRLPLVELGPRIARPGPAVPSTPPPSTNAAPPVATGTGVFDNVPDLGLPTAAQALAAAGYDRLPKPVDAYAPTAEGRRQLQVPPPPSGYQIYWKDGLPLLVKAGHFMGEPVVQGGQTHDWYYPGFGGYEYLISIKYSLTGLGQPIFTQWPTAVYRPAKLPAPLPDPATHPLAFTIPPDGFWEPPVAFDPDNRRSPRVRILPAPWYKGPEVVGG